MEAHFEASDEELDRLDRHIQDEKEAKVKKLIKEESLSSLKRRLDTRETQAKVVVQETVSSSVTQTHTHMIETDRYILQEIDNRELRDFYKQKFLEARRYSVIEDHYRRRYYEYNNDAFQREHEIIENLKEDQNGTQDD